MGWDGRNEGFLNGGRSKAGEFIGVIKLKKGTKRGHKDFGVG